MKREFYLIGIESTAHTFSASIAHAKGKIEILSNIVEKFPSSKQGFIPRDLANHHAAVCKSVLQKALRQAKITTKDLFAVAYSQGPGIGHCLHVGFVAAKTISIELKIPVIPVNHAVAHIEITRVQCKTKNPLVLYVSGGNTQILMKVKNKYHAFGETLDIGIGNMLDNLGRLLSLNPPDAVGVASQACKPSAKYMELPYAVKGMNVSFTGMLTFIEKKLIPKIANGEISKEDVCFSAQETAFAMLCEVTERALCHVNAKEVILCGGNARNKKLQEMLITMAKLHNAKMAIPTFEYAGDNAAMIAYTSAKMLMCKTSQPKNIKPVQKLRTDETTVNW